MRTSITESVQLIEQREMNTNIEYEQLTIRAANLREELHTQIERMLNDVVQFKIHIQKSLGSYEQFVADECERELDHADDESNEEDEDDQGSSSPSKGYGSTVVNDEMSTPKKNKSEEEKDELTW